MILIYGKYTSPSKSGRQSASMSLNRMYTVELVKQNDRNYSYIYSHSICNRALSHSTEGFSYSCAFWEII